MTRKTPTINAEIQALIGGKWTTLTTATTQEEASKARRQARTTYAAVRIVVA